MLKTFAPRVFKTHSSFAFLLQIAKGVTACRRLQSTMSTNQQLIQQAIARMMSSRKTSFEWQRDRPHKQVFFAFRNGNWRADNMALISEHVFSLTLITWNIDMLIPAATPRMRSALTYLPGVCSSISRSCGHHVSGNACLRSRAHIHNYLGSGPVLSE